MHVDKLEKTCDDCQEGYKAGHVREMCAGVSLMEKLTGNFPICSGLGGKGVRDGPASRSAARLKGIERASVPAA